MCVIVSPHLQSKFNIEAKLTKIEQFQSSTLFYKILNKTRKMNYFEDFVNFY